MDVYIYIVCVLQQFEHIKFHTNLDVEQYYGYKGVNEWNSECWEKELKEHDVSSLFKLC